MNNEIKKVIEKFKEVKNILKDFSTKDGVRIDIWTHLMRGCIINYVH